MPQDIGTFLPTKIPSLNDTADIQEALRLFYYGAPTGTNISAGEYPAESNTIGSAVPANSVARRLYDLDQRILNFQTGILPEAYQHIGDIIVGYGVSDPRALTSFDQPNGTVLTVDSNSPFGMKWLAPSVTETGTARLTNKTLVLPQIEDTGIKFLGPSGNAFSTTLISSVPTANRTIILPPVTTASTTLVGTDTQQTLTNKSIAASQITSQLAVANGGTGGQNADQARANLEIFNRQTVSTTGNDRVSYSGKIFVINPTIVAPNGANIDGASEGDLWFW